MYAKHLQKCRLRFRTTWQLQYLLVCNIKIEKERTGFLRQYLGLLGVTYPVIKIYVLT